MSRAGAGKPRVRESTLETVAIETGHAERSFTARKEHFEAPNWSRDGRTFCSIAAGGSTRFRVEGGTPVLLDTGDADRCNNDHGLSPDGRWLAISHTDPSLRQSVISIVPSRRRNAEAGHAGSGPSYWHGWSPDGKTLAYCAERNGEFDVYTIAGWQEARRRGSRPPRAWMTAPTIRPTASTSISTRERTGAMKIWRMNTRRLEPRASDAGRRIRRLVSASFAGRQVAGVSVVRQER